MNLFHRQLTFKNVLGKDVQRRTDFALSLFLVSLDIYLVQDSPPVTSAIWKSDELPEL